MDTLTKQGSLNMTRGSARFHEILKELGELHDRKQSDYGRKHDPFANVRATEEWGSPAWVGAMIRATDKLKRLQKVAHGGTLTNEGVVDSLKDLAVYAVIALVLWEESVDYKVEEPGKAIPCDDPLRFRQMPDPCSVTCQCSCKSCGTGFHCYDQRCYPLD